LGVAIDAERSERAPRSAGTPSASAHSTDELLEPSAPDPTAALLARAPISVDRAKDPSRQAIGFSLPAIVAAPTLVA
jgi:hypothetical protein